MYLPGPYVTCTCVTKLLRLLLLLLFDRRQAPSCSTPLPVPSPKPFQAPSHTLPITTTSQLPSCSYPQPCPTAAQQQLQHQAACLECMWRQGLRLQASGWQVHRCSLGGGCVVIDKSHTLAMSMLL